MMPIAELEHSRNGQRAFVRLTGEVDLSNAAELLGEIEDAVADARAVVVDLTEVEYLDSQGIHLLHRLSRTLADRKVTFDVVAPEGSIAGHVLRVSRMTDVISVRDALPE